MNRSILVTAIVLLMIGCVDGGAEILGVEAIGNSELKVRVVANDLHPKYCIDYVELWVTPKGSEFDPYHTPVISKLVSTENPKTDHEAVLLIDVAPLTWSSDCDYWLVAIQGKGAATSYWDERKVTTLIHRIR